MKMITKSIYCIVITIFFSNVCLSQEGKYSVQRAISLYKDSEVNIVEIDVQEQTKYLIIKIDSRIESGNLTIEIYNSKNEKQGNLSIGRMISLSGSHTKKKNANKNEKRDEHVIGRINKRFENPLQGKWTIKFIPEEAECDIHVKTELLF